MLLKCRYLSQFSVSELTKNAASISNAVERCPFMAHARRTLTTSASVSEGQKEDANIFPKPETAPHKISCTNSINCPFFKQVENLDLNKLLIKKSWIQMDKTAKIRKFIDSTISHKKLQMTKT